MAPRDDSAFLQSRRPWFALYGLRLKEVEDNDDEEEERKPPASVVASGPEIAKILQLRPLLLGSAACACKDLMRSVQNVELWKKACLEAWPQHGAAKIHQLSTKQYEGNWEAALADEAQAPVRRHLRVEELVHQDRHRGVESEEPVTPRGYLLSLHQILPRRQVPVQDHPPDGQQGGKTPAPDSSGPLPGPRRGQRCGRQVPLPPRSGVHEHGVPGTTSTEIRSKLKLRSTTPARNDRLDILALMSYARESAARLSRWIRARVRRTATAAGRPTTAA